MSDRGFCDRFEKASPKNVVEKLRKKIKDDIDQRRFEDGKPLCFTLFHTYCILLLPLDKFPDEFRHLYSEAILDIDMKDDLERSRVINWCRALRALYPIKTTADGNCLANAVSVALWGIEDNDVILRRMLYVTMTTDPRGMFKKRWMYQQSSLPEMPALDFRLNTEQYENEWNAVIRATSDIANETNHALPYAFLEAVHLYIIVNIIRRPVILLADNRARNLLGESIQESDIGGIYLPLEWDPKDCVRYPIVIGYSMNHFAPLVSQEDTTDLSTKAHVCPIVTPEIVQMKVHFLLPNEETRVVEILTKYLHVDEILIHNLDGVLNVPCARLTSKSLPDELNVIQAHRKDCERKFRFQVDEEVGHVPQNSRRNVFEQQQPFDFQVLNQKNEIKAAKIHNKHTKVKPVMPRHVVRAEAGKRKRCVTVGCKMYGSPEYNGLCSKCFNDFTVQYAEDEAASRQRRNPKHNIAAPVEHAAPVYNDLSIMGQNCQTGCGFRCSVETYPFCHECYPKYANQVRAVEPRRMVENTDLSLMPEKCAEPGCTYRASKQTFPYCHQCYDNHVPKAAPTAPPASVPQPMEVTGQQDLATNEQNLRLRIEPDDETHVVEIGQPTAVGIRPPITNAVAREPIETTIPNLITAEGSGVLARKCKTGGCLNNAIKGNDGFCDQCYDRSMFGEGTIADPVVESTPTCRTPGCNEKLASGCDMCLQCFLKDGKLPSVPESTRKQLSKSLEGQERTSPPNAENAGLRPLAHYNGDQQEVFAAHFNGYQQEIFGPSRPSGFKESIGVEEIGNDLLLINANRNLRGETQSDEVNETHRKYICAKAGCDGIRIENNNGLCYDCSKAGAVKTPIPRPEQNDLSGNTKTNLNESEPFISDTPFILSEAEIKQLNPIVVSSKQKIKCAAAICENMIYPPKKLCEDCTAAIEKSRAEKLKSGEMRHTAPISRPKVTKEPQRYTVPIAKQRAKLCIERDCERYGDPAQEDRCSWHYNLARQKFRHPSPPGFRKLIGYPQNATVPPTNYEKVASVSRNRDAGYRMPLPTSPVENGDELTAVMFKIENNQKSRSKCKNSARTGCDNYANPAKHGFCNHCFDAYPVQTLVGHPELPGRNQFD